MSGPRIGSLCSGYGGLDEAVISVFGGELAWWSDIEPGPIAVMDRHHPVPNLGDVKTMPWVAVPRVDILTAGYPCQPFSNAGKRKGVDDPRHLWPFIARGVGALRPALLILENVDAHLRKGFDVVLADLAVLGYDATWTIVRASDIGAPHRRKRLFVLAENTDQQPRIEWRSAASRQAQGRRSRPDAGRRSDLLAPDATRVGLESNEPSDYATTPSRRRAVASDPGREGLQVRPVEHHGPQRPAAQRSRRNAAADTEGNGRNQRRPEHEGLLGTADAPGDRGGRLERWGDYSAAIERWEVILGRSAPGPTTTGQRGARVLNPVFVEWMMGLPAGHVTDTKGLSRNQMLKLLGNGVVPQQAELAIRTLLPLLEVS